MFEQIKSLGSDTLIYGVSTIVARLLNFALVPLYANILSPSEFGIVATLYSYLAFIIIFYSFGMESAYLRFASSNEIGEKKDNFSTPFLSVAIVSAVFSILLILFSPSLTGVFQIDNSLYRLLYYTAGILFFDAVAMVPFASLRLDRKAKKFATIKVINITITVLLNVIILLNTNWGIEGIFFSNLAASIITFILLLPTIIRQLKFSFHQILLKELLKFGLPIVPAGISGIILQIADRPILKFLMDDAAVGIYQANYRLGIFMALINGMFEYAWRPFFLSHAQNPEAKKIFSRVMTYYLLATAVILVLLTLFLPNIIEYKFFGRYILPPPYWSGLNVVPWVMLGYIFSGIGTNLNAGVQIEKKTKYLFPTSLSGSVTNVALNFLIIPIFGIMGAAYATTLGYAVLAISLYFIVQRFYYIEYEFVRVGKLALVTAIVFVSVFLFELTLLLKIVLFTGWVSSLFVTRFFTKGELLNIKKMISRKSS
jgi:O-antigen/teichoic acid export membrane protein